MTEENAVMELLVSGMHCAGCAATVQQALKALPGVERVSVSLEGNSAQIEYSGGSLSVEDAIEAVAAKGFGASAA